ncbi:unnamed protein product [Lampetra fluviatilis]
MEMSGGKGRGGVREGCGTDAVQAKPLSMCAAAAVDDERQPRHVNKEYHPPRHVNKERNPPPRHVDDDTRNRAEPTITVVALATRGGGHASKRHRCGCCCCRGHSGLATSRRGM